MKRQLRRNRSVVFDEHPPFPHNMLIELTNRCNHRCIFCHHRLMKRKKTDCNKEFTFDIMRQAFQNGTREIGFYMMGEPFLNPDLDEYISYAHTLGFEYIYLTTNGVLATLDRTKKCVASGLNSIKFSVNAATPEHYKFIHGHDDYLLVKKNVYDLHDYITENNIELGMFITFLKTNITAGDVSQLEKDFAQVVDHIDIIECESQGIPIAELIEKGVVNRETYLRTSGGSMCPMVFNRIHVTCEGFLNACCMEPDGFLNVVDLHTVSLRDAWNSDAMVGLRRQFLSNTLSRDNVCYNCMNKTQFPVKPLNEKLCCSMK